MLLLPALAGDSIAATPCDNATHASQCGWYEAATLPPYVEDAIVAKGGAVGAGNVLVLTSGLPGDGDSEISNDMGEAGCGTNPDGWETYDCTLLTQFVPPTDSVVLAVSSEWFEWYQTIFTDWMTTSSAGVPTVDVSINSWITNKVDILPYGPMNTGAVILTSLSADKMVDFRVADSGDHIYDTALIVVPATWMAAVESSSGNETILCGNGELEPGEDCDDGNYLTDDDCSSLCLSNTGGPPPPPPTPPSPATTCGNLVYSWPTGLTAPYTCGADLCLGYRCVVGNTISPACYTAAQCAEACGGSCVDVQTAELDCSTMCTVQPSATEPPPPVPTTCDGLEYVWDDGTTMPYTCNDDCKGERCVIDATISPTCYDSGDCDETTCPGGTCVDIKNEDCLTLCDLGDLPATCLPSEEDQLRLAPNQSGPCQGNMEKCKNQSGEYVWRLADGSFEPDSEACNGIDDDCNGAVDDMFVTCGDTGLCQNTVNTCDPANPSVPVVCNPLPAPSPVEICNDGLDNDCEGSPDDGCECGDDECMPGETYENCPQDCPAPDDGTPCDDGDLCTTDDAYVGGTCEGGAPLVCDQGNACVIGGPCNPATGCTATKLNCDDAVDCTVDSCDEALGCLNTPADAACDDGDACTTDTCDQAAGCLNTPADSDGDGTADCNDGCPGDPAKSDAGACGCGVADDDSDSDGTADCNDGCPSDPAKVAAGVCGCGVADVDTNGNGTTDCLETTFADLATSMTQSPVTPRAGRRLKYRVAVANLGPDAIPSATIQITLDGGAVDGLKVPRDCTVAGNAITCTTGAVRDGRQVKRTISLLAPAATTLTVTATASSPLLDPEDGDQTATLTTVIP